MNILVTGGAGFIGSHVCERLLGDGHVITIIDDLNDFYSPTVKRQNLESVQKVGAIRFYDADITDEHTLKAIFRDSKPEAVIHLAARAGVRPSLEHPLLYERVNVYGTLVLLELSRLAKVSKFIFASSSSIYGVTNQVPFSEDDYCNLPISPYAATKIAGEKLCYTYAHLYGTPTTCLRFFTVYGPRQRPDLAIRKFTERIADGCPIQVYGDGSTGRDYTFIEDITSGIIAALFYDCKYEIFNLGNSKPVSLMTLIRTIERVVGRTSKIEWLPEQPGDVPITYANIDKAQRLLGYNPRTSLEDGIEKFAAWWFKRDVRHATAV